MLDRPETAQVVYSYLADTVMFDHMFDHKVRTMAPSAKYMRRFSYSRGALLLAATVLAQAAHAGSSSRNVLRAGTCRALLGVNGGAFEPPATDAALTANGGSDPSGKKRRKVKKKVKRQDIPLEATPPPSKSKAKAKAKAKDKERPISGGREGACLRRIKREWKDAVDLGVAYDWRKGITVTRKKKNESEPKAANNYVRMGPMGRNLLHWHFSVQGTPNSVYEKGVYHGRIVLPKDYPMSPPRVQMLTPSGRFIPGNDICLSASSYHPESWTPRWTILSLIDALRLHMLTSANEIGGQNASNEQRRKRALESRTWGRGVVCHEKMLNDGIFTLEALEEEEEEGAEEAEQQQKAEEDEIDEEVDGDIAESQIELTPTPPTTEDILGMVTEGAVKRQNERTTKEVTRCTRSSAPVLVVKFIVKFIFYSILLLLRGVISVLKSPIKLGLMALMVIFAHLNRSS